MEFVKIKADFKYEKGRLYRVLYVRPDITLIELGCVLLNSLGAAYEHYFLFKTKENIYNPVCFLDQYCLEDDLPMYKYRMRDLGNKFEFIYDTGDGWDFDITVYKATKDFAVDKKERKQLAFIKEGQGQGIWEDNIAVLYDYFSGDIKPEDKENDAIGNYFPWNFQIEKFGDFDNPLNLEDIQEKLDLVTDDILKIMDYDVGYIREKIRR